MDSCVVIIARINERNSFLAAFDGDQSIGHKDHEEPEGARSFGNGKAIDHHKKATSKRRQRKAHNAVDCLGQSRGYRIIANGNFVVVFYLRNAGSWKLVKANRSFLCVLCESFV